MEFTLPFDRGSAIRKAQPRIVEQPEPIEIPSDYSNIFMAHTTSMIEFPIGDIRGDTHMKHIPLATLPNFHDLSSKDLDTFLFEFDVVRRGYDYISNDQKLKIFPATLKGTTLRWFMGLGGKSTTTWDDMKMIFLEKQQDCCKYQDIKEKIFKIV